MFIWRGSAYYYKTAIIAYMKHRDLTPFLDVRQNQLSFEVSESDAIDTRALGLFASNIVILIFVAQSSLHASKWTATLVALLIISSLCNVLALLRREYAGASVSALDHPEYLEYDEDDLVKQLIADTEEAITKDNRLNRKRSKYVVGSLVLTVIASVILLMLL